MKTRRFAAIALPVVGLISLSAHAAAMTFKVTKVDIGGEGGHDYIVAEPGTGRVFVSRESHFMVVDGATGKLVGDIADTPGVHGAALVGKWNHGFTTNRGDSTVTMFDLKTLAPIRQIAIEAGGLDGIMYDESADRVILTNHSRPVGTAVAIDANTGDITGTAELEDTSPEGAASDGKGRLFVNNEGTSTIQVIDEKTMKAIASWPIAPCEGPTGIAYDKASKRIFSGCSNTSVVVDPATGKVVATIANGNGVDGLGWDAAEKLLYIPAGRDGNVTVVHQDSPDSYTVVATVATMAGTKTVAVDPVKHVAYALALEYGAPPSAGAGGAPPANGRGFGRGPRGPVVGAWFFTISH
jgi:DNA-binding beta-propeller fold protein YncE